MSLSGVSFTNANPSVNGNLITISSAVLKKNDQGQINVFGLKAPDEGKYSIFSFKGLFVVYLLLLCFCIEFSLDKIKTP